MPNEQEQKPQTVNDVRAAALLVALENTNTIARLCELVQVANNHITKITEENAQLKAQIAEVKPKE